LVEYYLLSLKFNSSFGGILRSKNLDLLPLSGGSFTVLFSFSLFYEEKKFFQPLSLIFFLKLFKQSSFKRFPRSL